MNQDKSCPFCDRIAHGVYDRHSLSTVSFEPLNPVIPGHLLIVPRMHVADATVSLGIAAELGKPCNLITSVGTAATQTVRHLHFHLVPRRVGDGLTLPWTGREVTGA
jgi:histidine triad (HIT) family protein